MGILYVVIVKVLQLFILKFTIILTNNLSINNLLALIVKAMQNLDVQNVVVVEL